MAARRRPTKKTAKASSTKSKPVRRKTTVVRQTKSSRKRTGHKVSALRKSEAKRASGKKALNKGAEVKGRKKAGAKAKLGSARSAKTETQVGTVRNTARSSDKPRLRGKSKLLETAISAKTLSSQVETKLPPKHERSVDILKSGPTVEAPNAVANAKGAGPSAATSAAKSEVPAAKPQKPVGRDPLSLGSKVVKPAGQRQGFKLNEFVVYPAHGVGQIVAIEDQEVAGFRLELFVINFSKDKMTLRVPTSKVAGVGLRKISDPDTAKRSLDILTGRARIKRTMWSRRAQEYETKINSGDINAIAEVVRDLYRSEAQPEQSYSERQLYEAALDRMVREIAAVQKSNEIDALKTVEAQLQKGHGRNKPSGPLSEPSDGEIEEAA